MRIIFWFGTFFGMSYDIDFRRTGTKEKKREEQVFHKNVFTEIQYKNNIAIKNGEYDFVPFAAVKPVAGNKNTGAFLKV